MDSIERLCEELIRKFNSQEEKMAELKAENDRLYKNIGRGFPITEEEDQDIKKWIKNHVEEKHSGHFYVGAIGGMFSYNFLPTSIGTIGEIKCSCGETYTFREL